jgi:hypothetical protein
MFALLILIAAVLLGIVLFKQRQPKKTIRRRAWENVPAYDRSYGIPATPKMLESEIRDKQEVMNLLESLIRASGLFKADRIPELMDKLRKGAIPFGRANTNMAFEGDEVISIEEKRKLGLNTRMKYTKDFIGYFVPEKLAGIEPKSILSNMHLDAQFRVARRRELAKLKKSGIAKIEILPSGTVHDCDKIKGLRKIHNIDKAPELPLPGCDAQYCMCDYLAHF